MNQYKQITWEDWAGETRVSTAVRAFTDYPIEAFGDVPDQEAPVRECWVLAYNGRNRVELWLEQDGKHYVEQVKLCYVYRKPGRCGEGKIVDRWKLRDYRNRPAWKYLRRRYTKTTFDFYPFSENGVGYRYHSLTELTKRLYAKGEPGEIWFWFENHHNNGGSFSEHDYFATFPQQPSVSWARPVKKFRRHSGIRQR